MGWKDIEQKVFALKETDYDLNREIFVEVWGWSYPLIGAADHQFERLSRENGRTVVRVPTMRRQPPRPPLSLCSYA
jgi:hypothetical protein